MEIKLQESEVLAGSVVNKNGDVCPSIHTKWRIIHEHYVKELYDKMGNQTIYVVTDGDYSAYHIVAIFSSREKAKEFLLANKCGEIEEFEINPEFWTPPDGMKHWKVRIGRDGTIMFSGELSPTPLVNTFKSFHYLYDGLINGTLLSWTGWAKSEEHAVKIANEVRTQLVANNKWTEIHDK